MKYRYTPPAVFRIKLIGVLGALLLATLGCVFEAFPMLPFSTCSRNDE